MTSLWYLWYSLYGSFTVLFKNILKCLLTITDCIYCSVFFIIENLSLAVLLTFSGLL